MLFFFFLHNCAKYRYKKPTKILLLQWKKRNRRLEQTLSQSPSWQVHRWTLKFHPCDCHCLVGPWVTEKKSCPRGNMCILGQRWNSIGNVLSAVMLSFIYTLSSFDFWDCLTTHHISPLLRAAVQANFSLYCKGGGWVPHLYYLCTIYAARVVHLMYFMMKWLQRWKNVEYNILLWI